MNTLATAALTVIITVIMCAHITGEHYVSKKILITCIDAGAPVERCVDEILFGETNK